ncbi:XrtA/PEP-CTERM system TPR-repeat protein PrsT [Pleionea sp. CnH1-48]|uniref:XrtA/PEP-CTERM system TPR-repeat protein PrsT n=1 Tax=Pleionea sp. CnH1-48 TaxID=2954494 RepID=UPI00209804EE|nr:XrtA/PEP-CTERM system TPR-repeat protein PrsT [Pleionea sp. CnH1-48]MCO7226236.1 PEP-CTERM system TPR-repeat protein PrsT [Pleionea sp. CnH1-48]
MKKQHKFIVASTLSIALGLSGCSDQELSIDELKSKAAEATAAKDYKSAVIFYRNLITKENLAEYRLQLAAIYMDTFNYAAAEKELEKARELNAAAAQWLVPLLKSWYVQNDTVKILANFKDSDFKYDDLKGDLSAFKALVYFKRRELEKAAQQITESSSLYGDGQVLKMALAQQLFLDGKADDALTLLNKIDNQYLDSEKRLLKARILSNQNKLRDAEKELAAAHERYVFDPRILVRHTNILLVLKDNEAIEKNIKALQQRFPGSLQTVLMDAKWKFINNQNVEARDLLQKALAISPEHPEANMFMGLVSGRLEQWDKAASYLGETLTRFPGHKKTIEALAQVYMFGLKQPEKAVPVLETYAHRFSNDFTYQSHLIDALMATAQYDKALKLINSLLEKRPDLKALQASKALAVFQLGDRQKAVDALKGISGSGLASNLLLVKLYLQDNKFVEADKLLRELKEGNPDHPMVLELEAKYALSVGKEDKAYQLLDQIVTRLPKTKTAWQLMAKIQVDAKNLEGIDDLINRMSQTFENDTDVLMLKLESARLRKDTAQVGELLNAIWEKDKTKVAVGRRLVNSYLVSDPYKAESVAREMLKSNPNSADALFNLGKVMLRLRNLEEAVQYFIRAKNLETNNPAHYLALIETYLAKDEPSRADDLFNEALIKFADNSMVKSAYAKALARKGKFDEAYIVAATLPEKNLSLPLMANIALSSKDFEKALDYASQARKLGDSKELAVLTSRILNADGQAQKAIKNLEGWITSNEENSDISFQLSNLRLEHKQHKEALKGYLELLKQHPENMVLLNNITWLYVELKDPEAQKYAQKLRVLNPQPPVFIDTIAWSEILFGDPAKGVSELEQLFARKIYFPEASYHMAIGYLKIGKSDQAKTILETLSRNKGNTQIARMAKDKLAELSG